MTRVSAQQIPAITSPKGQPVGAVDLARNGYTHLPAGTFSPADAEDWRALCSLWDGMAPDVYLKASSYRRRRRYAKLTTGLDADGQLTLTMLPTEPFIQHTPDNPRFDGIPRHFEPCNPALLDNPIFRQMVKIDLDAIGTEPHGWEVGIHQMRVIWSGKDTAEATPEGRHSDGHLFVAIHLISLSPSTGGISQVYDSRAAAIPVFATRLESCGDTLIVNDRQMLHQVTPLAGPGGVGLRDVLVIDFLRERYGEGR